MAIRRALALTGKYDPGRWWRHSGVLATLLRDILRSEIRRLRPGSADALLSKLRPEMPLGEGGLGLDSLELLVLSSAVSECLHLHRACDWGDMVARNTFGDWCNIAELGLERFSASITFRSSGSTGTPRTYEHSLQSLITEARIWTQLITPPRRMLCAVPFHHIYGFIFGVLLPQCFEVEVEDVRPFHPSSVPALIRAGDLIIGTPPFWAAAGRASAYRWPSDATGVSSTATLPPHILRSVLAAGLARMVEVYGSSETGGIGWRKDPDGPFGLLPGWSRLGDRLLREDSFVQSPDRLEWVNTREFYISDRRDGAIQVGGLPVFPSHVRDILLRHPGIAEVAVMKIVLAEGDRVKAFVVPLDPNGDPGALRTSIEAFAEHALTPQERPRAYTFGTQLPVSALGKIIDWHVSQSS